MSTAEEGPPATDDPPRAQARLAEEILVTGSRLRRKDLHTPAPVTVISSEQIAASGHATVGDLLQDLPEQGNAVNRQFNNGGDGSTRVSLRGLGDYRTLVLLNGRRFVAGGTGADASVDLGSIPSAAVESIEVLKDGASPIYGSDAMGGVVNIITRKTWSGAEATAYAGVSSRGDGNVYDLAVTTGRAGDGGSLLFSAGFTKQKEVWSGSRPYGGHMWAYDATGTNSPRGLVGPYRLGVGTIPEGRFLIAPAEMGVPRSNPTNDARIDAYNALVTAYPGSRDFVRDASTGAWRPYLGPALPVDGGDGYNFQPANYLVTPSQRLSLFATGDARLGSPARAFFEASYVSRESQQKLAPEPLLTPVDGIVVSADNRYNPFGVDIFDVRKRLSELGNRRFTQNVDALRLVVGLDGELPGAAGPLGGWAWEIAFNHGRTQGTDLKGGYTHNSRLRDALGPSFQDGQGWHCGTAATGAIPGCVPLDLFGGAGSITPDQVAALTFDGAARGTNQLSAFQASFSGELFRLLADRPAGLAAGYEYRRVSGSRIPDPVTAAGDASTDGALRTTRGAQDVHEAFAELSLPIADGLPLVHRLEAQVAARLFRYSGFGNDRTWKLGGRWTPIPEVTVRGTWSTAFRAPAVAELFYGQVANSAFPHDPCAGVDGLGATEPVSPHCGAAAGNGVQEPRVSVLGGGNPALRPEEARIFTAGVVLEPRFAKDLSLTLDYYDIAIDRAIYTIGFMVIDACYPMSPDRAPQLCHLLQRDPSTQALASVLDTPQNAVSEKMSGLDAALRYRLPTPIGRFALGVDATWLRRYDIALPDGSVLHAKGTYDWGLVGFAHPTWRGNATLGWALGGLGAGASLRYVGPYRECADATGDFSINHWAFCSLDHAFERTVAASYRWDAFASYRTSTSAGQTDLQLGVHNLFDAAPPAVYTNGTYPSDPATYDFMGRFFYARLTHRL